MDRLPRLPATAWKALRAEIEAKGLQVVALDFPTSHRALQEADTSDEFTSRMQDAINGMMLDMMAAIARKDYEQRRERQRQGIEKAKQEGKYQGRPKESNRGAPCRPKWGGAWFLLRPRAPNVGYFLL